MVNRPQLEAAQFALLRRLAPSLRHRLIGTLHPISLLAELAGRRLSAEPADLAAARDSVAKIQAQARLAAAASVATLAWITAEEAPAAVVREVAEECVALLRTDSEMRGTDISSRVGDIDVKVEKRALRVVLTASLVAAVDAVPRAARIEVAAAREGDDVVVWVETRSLQESGAQEFITDERPLTWEDVEVLAQSEGVEVRATTAPAAICCRFRRRPERASAKPG
jgi:signal transduction histidine kinase